MTERCGIVVNGDFLECENIAIDKVNYFAIHPDHFIENDVQAIWHTHPKGFPFLSANDRLSQIATDKQWILIHDGKRLKFNCVPLLVGRDFKYGDTDCGTIIEDAYMLAGIPLRPHDRGVMSDDLKTDKIMKSLLDSGFYVVSLNEIKAGDVIVTSYQGKYDHMMLYIGDEKILHHLYNRLSKVDFFHDYYRRKVSAVLRHRRWENDMIVAIENDLKAVDYGASYS